MLSAQNRCVLASVVGAMAAFAHGLETARITGQKASVGSHLPSW